MNPVLEITLYHGKLMLNSANANYSFGSLHQVMKRALAFVKREYPETKIRRVLMLGYGGGSAANLLLKRYPGVQVTALELDQTVIDIAVEWFPQPDVNLICANAMHLEILKGAQFDLIVADVFTDLKTPESFRTAAFYQKAIQNLQPNGVLVQNLILSEAEVMPSLNVFRAVFSNVLAANPVGLNRLFFGQRPLQPLVP